MIKAWGVLGLAALVLGACRDECREYSQYTCKQLESATYNVEFFFPKNNDREYHIGVAQGLKQCGAVAYDYAASKKLDRSDWGYVCCLQTADSSCAEKHR